ncbi:hypothetical protein HBI82_011870 [Parastagonospora nodorum]|nr:hypothetical protein HBI82_011870 [Parastagonospora nodorum]
MESIKWPAQKIGVSDEGLVRWTVDVGCTFERVICQPMTTSRSAYSSITSFSDLRISNSIIRRKLVS